MLGALCDVACKYAYFIQSIPAMVVWWKTSTNDDETKKNKETKYLGLLRQTTTCLFATFLVLTLYRVTSTIMFCTDPSDLTSCSFYESMFGDTLSNTTTISCECRNHTACFFGEIDHYNFDTL